MPKTEPGSLSENDLRLRYFFRHLVTWKYLSFTFSWRTNPVRVLAVINQGIPDSRFILQGIFKNLDLGREAAARNCFYKEVVSSATRSR